MIAFNGKIISQKLSKRYPTKFEPMIEPILAQISEMPRAEDLEDINYIGYLETFIYRINLKCVGNRSTVAVPTILLFNPDINRITYKMFDNTGRVLNDRPMDPIAEIRKIVSEKSIQY